MYLNHIKLSSFRNVCDQEISLSPSVNLITGINGQGKTNLIEALYLLSLGRSFRTTDISDLIQWGEKQALVRGELMDRLGTIDLQVALHEKGKTLQVNQSIVRSLSDFMGKLVTITFVPGDMALVQGSPAGRRQFLDKHMVDVCPSYVRSLLQYQKALRNKHALLKQPQTSFREILPWNLILAQEGSIIRRERRRFLSELSPYVERSYRTFSSDGLDLSIRGHNSHGELLTSQDEDPESLKEKLEKKFEQERRTRSSSVGPHRDDVGLFLSGKDARSFSSQGQARSIVLALKMGVVELLEYKRSECPVVLLDDVASELDEVRSRKFFEALLAGQRQVFITDTNIPTGLAHVRVIEVCKGVYSKKIEDDFSNCENPKNPL